MKIPDDVVEAGARALWGMGCTPREWRWEALPENKKQLWRSEARACLTAALRQAEEHHGAVLARVPEPKRGDDDLSPYLQGKEAGWNNAIVQMRANKWGGTDEG